MCLGIGGRRIRGGWGCVSLVVSVVPIFGV